MTKVSIALKKVFKYTALGMGVLISTTAQAYDFENPPGGIDKGTPATDPQWFRIGGLLKVDEHSFIGKSSSKGNEFFSGANLRSVAVDFDGGINKDLSYTLGFSYSAANNTVEVEDAYLTYEGFGDKLRFSIGQVNPGFCLENTNSSKWIPFFERSMAATALTPCPGLGVSVNKWQENYSLTAALTQPKQNATVSGSDRLGINGRATYLVLNNEANKVQVGASGHWQEDSKSSNTSEQLRFRTAPEARARNLTNVLDTGPFLAKHHYILGLELAGQNGPLYGDAEFQYTEVKRAGNTAQNHNHFYGYHVQVAYVLTGEARTFKANNGTFGQVVPKSPDRGAWEIAGRYSFLDLNNRDIIGGRGQNTSAAVNYYMNKNVRFSGEYIHARLHPTNSSSVTLLNNDKRKVHILGLRMQLVF